MDEHDSHDDSCIVADPFRCDTMIKEVYERIRAGFPDIDVDLFELMEKGELTDDEYYQLVDDYAPYIDLTVGCLADDYCYSEPLIQIERIDPRKIRYCDHDDPDRIWNMSDDSFLRINTISVAGSGYVPGIREKIGRLKDGQEIFFVREPDNVYDRSAVLVVNGQGDKLGYIPRSYSSSVAALIDANIEIRGYVDQIGRDSLSIVLMMKKKDTRAKRFVHFKHARLE